MGTMTPTRSSEAARGGANGTVLSVRSAETSTEPGHPSYAAALTVRSESGDDAPATVIAAETEDGHHLDFVDTREPERWITIVSTLVGCPVRCPMCDAGGHYEGRLTAQEILAQLDLLVARRFPSGRVTVPAWEVHFTRMGDPAFNDAVLDVLEVLPARYGAPSLVPVVSTVAPATCEDFFAALLEVKDRRYPRGFQLQFSLHTTDEAQRRRMVPVRTWSFVRMANYGAQFHRPGERKVVLAFAAAAELPLEPAALRAVFDPAHFVVKLTPLNPSEALTKAGLTSLLDATRPEAAQAVAARFEAAGFDTRVAFTAPGEDAVGASCGLFTGGGRDGPVRPRRTLR